MLDSPFKIEYFDRNQERVRVRVVYAQNRDHAIFLLGLNIGGLVVRRCELDVEQAEIDLEMFLAYRAKFAENCKIAKKPEMPSHPYLWVINDTVPMMKEIAEQAGNIRWQIGPHVSGDKGSHGFYVHVEDLAKLKKYFKESMQLAEADWTQETIRLANAIKRHWDKVAREERE